MNARTPSQSTQDANCPDYDASRRRILQIIGETDDVTFLLLPGNHGDELIRAGTRQLLAPVYYREIPIGRLNSVTGHTALISGSGGWCRAYHGVTLNYLPKVEHRFERVVILPSTFDTSVEQVRRTLGQTKAFVFARERVSFEQIRELCEADLAHDCAFYFDFTPYHREGRGTLNAFRTDNESIGHDIPADNNDISVNCQSLDEWIWTIARYALIRTDRAHVMIAGARLGKSIEYGASNYHKVNAIAEYSLAGYPIQHIDDPLQLSHGTGGAVDKVSSPQDEIPWTDRLKRAQEEIVSLVQVDEKLILVDELQWGVGPRIAGRSTLPFLERDGQYWGRPADSPTAVRELMRLRKGGAAFIIFAWPAFWWLNHYAELRDYLDRTARLVYRNDRIIAYDLRP